MRESVFWYSSFETLAEVFFTDITGAIRTLMGGRNGISIIYVFNKQLIDKPKRRVI